MLRANGMKQLICEHKLKFWHPYYKDRELIRRARTFSVQPPSHRLLNLSETG